MTPQQFGSKFGKPSIQVATLQPGIPLIVPEDWGRYLLVFWNVPNNINIRPQGDGSVVVPAFNMNSGVEPLILTHALHGSLVNIGYSVETAGPATTICILEGQMIDTPTPVATPTREVTRATNRSAR